MSPMVLSLRGLRFDREKSYLDSAIACVVSKVRQVVTGVGLEQKMLLCYTEALHLLRSGVADPALHDRLDMLAATQLLAIYEMLDSTSNESWLQHVAGAAAMAKLHDEGNLRLVFADAHRAFIDNIAIEWSIRLPLLARAHELRCRLKAFILRSEQQFVNNRKTSPKEVDLLGLCLITIIMLDRLITAWRRDLPLRGRDLEADTQELWKQMIRLELDAAEKHPGKEVLRAFQRQVNYPVLTYNE
ncbi:uncharacterized protein MYCFIDRAFT_195229 [Pseudocercospora fijiensis CIRAD86]|uniref:Uncharacterized protein n=1 Tax=Pseudocercospora fijiensis (strain CIRAD86) TaxID=383855 RepID=M2ZYP9_PSEFD|nr:uncharacterized protein MYCFIDRAFT_195229 [Pseudocercospora fijiensis CIRAD86]EME84074.1 hypothetical protein MYCFIDRAFT_195229 [Pseudocercospora fijiensis CIRAD86]